MGDVGSMKSQLVESLRAQRVALAAPMARTGLDGAGGAWRAGETRSMGASPGSLLFLSVFFCLKGNPKASRHFGGSPQRKTALIVGKGKAKEAILRGPRKFPPAFGNLLFGNRPRFLEPRFETGFPSIAGQGKLPQRDGPVVLWLCKERRVDTAEEVALLQSTPIFIRHLPEE